MTHGLCLLLIFDKWAENRRNLLSSPGFPTTSQSFPVGTQGRLRRAVTPGMVPAVPGARGAPALAAAALCGDSAGTTGFCPPVLFVSNRKCLLE